MHMNMDKKKQTFQTFFMFFRLENFPKKDTNKKIPIQNIVLDLKYILELSLISFHSFDYLLQLFCESIASIVQT